MPEDKLSYELTPFERLEIIRLEVEERQEELAEVEATIRGVLYEVERLRLLAGISKAYAKAKAPEGYDKLDKLEARRVQLGAQIAALKAALPAIETQATGAAGGTAPAAGPAGASGGAKAQRKPKGFSSFDDFRSKKT